LGEDYQIDIFKGLLNHYQDIANAFEDESLAATASSDSMEKILLRRNMLVDFLVTHLSRHCHVPAGGYIYDSSGNVSQEIDIVVTGDLTLQFEQSGQSFHCLEGCYCAISISEMLDKSACVQCLENLASIPLIPETTAGIGFLFGVRPQHSLLKVILAFDAADADTILSHIDEFYMDHPIPQGNRPDLIIVNNRYGIVRTGEQGAMTTDDREIPAHAFHTFGHSESEPNVGGYSLLYLLAEIQRRIASSSHSGINFGEYLDQLPI